MASSQSPVCFCPRGRALAAVRVAWDYVEWFRSVRSWGFQEVLSQPRDVVMMCWGGVDDSSVHVEWWTHIYAPAAP